MAPVLYLINFCLAGKCNNLWVGYFFNFGIYCHMSNFLSSFVCIYSVNYRPGVRNAIQIAALLAKEQMMGSPLLGRIPPM